MNAGESIQRIKSKGYWRVLIRPTSFEKLRIPAFSVAQELVQSCIVYWRGWDYPHWNQQTVRNMNDWVESWDDWEGYLEYWRFYLSGQFIHYLALHEDHVDMESILPIQYPPRRQRTGYLSIVSTTYRVTEILEFAARLANKDILRPSATISIGLHNIKGHQLVSLSSTRSIPNDFVYSADGPIVMEREIPQRELVAGPDNFAVDFVIEIFERFNWNNPSRQMISEDQKRLRERRL